MKTILLFLIFLAAGFAGGFGAARWKTFELLSSKLSRSAGASTVFRPTLYPLENVSFCIVIAGRNNGAYLEKTLQSAFSQNYDNFRIVYIDDASDDGSFDLAKELIYNSPRFTRAELLHNERKLGMLACLSRAVAGCEGNEVVVVLNGEDWLSHEWVLQRLNQYYADPDLWLTYGQSLEYPTFQLGSSRPLPETCGRGIRGVPFSASHLKTFYAGLFKKINGRDLQIKGEFFQGSDSLGYMMPMLEMAQGHFQCLPEILYITNRETVRGEDRDSQAFFEKHIRSLHPYESLSCLEESE